LRKRLKVRGEYGYYLSGPNKSPTIGASRGWQSETAMRRKGCPGLSLIITFAISEPIIILAYIAPVQRIF
jgi:hypothetical protein